MLEGVPESPLLRVAGVEGSADLQRVLALERRLEVTSELVDVLSQHLRLDPAARLRAPQAAALRELYEVGGLFGPMRVGSGKTLVTLLAPTLLGAQRPVLMVPASLRDKTRREFAEYRQQWRVRLPHIVSYTELGRVEKEHYLLELAPDLLILDEAHKVRNLAAAVTRRVGRCVELLRPRVVALSGTLVTDGLMDYWHLLLWCLGNRAPVPMLAVEAGKWSRALDRDAKERLALGALEAFGADGYHAFMRASRGVVPTPGNDCPATIEISSWSPALPPALAEMIAETKETGMRPDGELLEDMEIADVLCQLAQGFYYVWDPLPPEWWLKPRRAWNAYVRYVLEQQLVGFDSPSMVAMALDRSDAITRETDRYEQVRVVQNVMPPSWREGRGLLQAWRAVRDRFEPNTRPVWVNDAPLREAAKLEHTLIWVKHRAAGERLQQLGVSFYGGGTDPQSAVPGSTIALSIAAHGTGRNLQAWHRNAVMCPPANDRAHEQLIGRTHRQGQRSDAVYVSYLDTIAYHGDVLARVKTQAKATSKASGFTMKLAEATWV